MYSSVNPAYSNLYNEISEMFFKLRNVLIETEQSLNEDLDLSTINKNW